MKITDTLDQLLRLLVTSDEEGHVNEKVSRVSEPVSPVSEPKSDTGAEERGPERALPDWVRRANERVLAADSASEAAPLSASEALSEAGGDRQDVEAEVPAVSESAMRWAQIPEADPEPIVVGEPAAEVVGEPEPIEEPVAFEGEAEQEHVFGTAAAGEPELETQASAVAHPEVEVPAADLDNTHDPGTALVPVDHDLAHLETAARVAESLNLGFHLGSAVERIASAANQGSEGVSALREAAWLIERYIAILEQRPIGADLHLSAARLARAGDAIAGLKALAEALDADTASVETEQTLEPAEPKPSAVAVADSATASEGADPEPDSWAPRHIGRFSADPYA
jgi:hypothetical protein